MAPHIAPSILAADFYDLRKQLEAVVSAGVDVFHIDIMDGQFVDNISVGLPVVASLRGRGAALDVHLMIKDPGRYARRFIEAGAGWLTVHVEAVPPPELPGLIENIRSWGGVPGLALRPDTEVEAAEPYLPLCGQLLIMTVPPGFGGQGYSPDGNRRIARARALINRVNPSCLLAADGGLDCRTVGQAVEAGLERVVAGSAVFGSDGKGCPGGPGEAVRRLMESINAAERRAGG
ncbi:MAG: ribulose-phosphate 3-epimerase [Oscillospiraceae bacterium]|nr:ribulose-phosphate 3-epimerase [Oscillospiraceae bacterium]